MCSSSSSSLLTTNLSQPQTVRPQIEDDKVLRKPQEVCARWCGACVHTCVCNCVLCCVVSVCAVEHRSPVRGPSELVREAFTRAQSWMFALVCVHSHRLRRRNGEVSCGQFQLNSRLRRLCALSWGRKRFDCEPKWPKWLAKKMPCWPSGHRL